MMAARPIVATMIATTALEVERVLEIDLGVVEVMSVLPCMDAGANHADRREATSPRFSPSLRPDEELDRLVRWEGRQCSAASTLRRCR